MRLQPQAQLGPYQILGPIGAGGMGEVYRARDPRMDREVAIKVSAEQFSDRFAREVRAVAALSHPNVCTLHDVGPNYLVMELVEGATLAERLNEDPFRWRRRSISLTRLPTPSTPLMKKVSSIEISSPAMSRSNRTEP